MILLTVGTQLPFERLVRMVDEVAPELADPIVAQTGPGDYKPRHFEARSWVDPSEFQALLGQCRLLISHAGIGSLLGAQRARKPLILVPRRAALREHRNDHQMATAAALGNRPGIYVAHHADELRTWLGQPLVPTTPEAGLPAMERLRASIADFVRGARA